MSKWKIFWKYVNRPLFYHPIFLSCCIWSGIRHIPLECSRYPRTRQSTKVRLFPRRRYIKHPSPVAQGRTYVRLSNQGRTPTELLSNVRVSLNILPCHRFLNIQHLQKMRNKLLLAINPNFSCSKSRLCHLGKGKLDMGLSVGLGIRGILDS